ncbi:hypothetical protein XSR1_10346 [Xenorhabdus szentirmaii DSM 16338]|uniref:Uncharacterized protein n=1 Tax=Xenorhabdus szentirmaii DSM 16338 TaxID=1427518 RepID=W1IUQ7_9GAMM|nr:hypothetical protein XSR1_10346 [Xenorhabdus szentirmaii DSM 16338]
MLVTLLGEDWDIVHRQPKSDSDLIFLYNIRSKNLPQINYKDPSKKPRDGALVIS